LGLLLIGLVYAHTNSDFSAFWESDDQALEQPIMQASMVPMLTIKTAVDPALLATDSLLKKYQIPESRRARVAKAIVNSSRKHKMDPRLVASVVIVETRGNPFAISESDAVGIMQIHVPTWSRVIEEEGIDLFKIEDNIDLGVRILKTYVSKHGVAEGIKRYNGWHSDRPETLLTAEAYLQKVQSIYGAPKPVPVAAF
jgi:soluble lytic murein transglycosylase-like protein